MVGIHVPLMNISNQKSFLTPQSPSEFGSSQLSLRHIRMLYKCTYPTAESSPWKCILHPFQFSSFENWFRGNNPISWGVTLFTSCHITMSYYIISHHQYHGRLSSYLSPTFYAPFLKYCVYSFDVTKLLPLSCGQVSEIIPKFLHQITRPAGTWTCLSVNFKVGLLGYGIQTAWGDYSPVFESTFDPSRQIVNASNCLA